MTFAWTKHRFSGGALALDVANSVILRHDPERRIDRLAEPAQLPAFAEAASRLSGERQRFGSLVAGDSQDTVLLLTLREAIDAHFRQSLLGSDDTETLATLLEAIAKVLRRSRPANDLLTATARSALALSAGAERERMKICGSCGWLFLDRSKNGSRIWCDMAVCGNRVKASRHYAARKATESVKETGA